MSRTRTSCATGTGRASSWLSVLQCVLVLVLTAPTLSACGDGAAAPRVPVPTDIELSVDDEVLAYGEMTEATVVVYDERDEPISGIDLTWSSSDETVAQVSPGGRIIAVGVGEAQVTARSGELRASANLSIEPLEVSLEARESTVAAYRSLTFDLPAEIPTPEETVAGQVGSGAGVAVLPVEGQRMRAVIPDLGTGPETLVFAPDPNHRIAVQFDAVAAPPIADPAGAVDAVLAELTSTADSISAADAGSGAGLAYLNAAETMLADLQGQVASMGADELRHMAGFIAAYPELFAGASAGSSASALRVGPMATAGTVTERQIEYVGRFLLAVSFIEGAAVVLPDVWKSCQALGPLNLPCRGVALAGAAGLVLKAAGVLPSLERLMDEAFKPTEQWDLGPSSDQAQLVLEPAPDQAASLREAGPTPDEASEAAAAATAQDFYNDEAYAFSLSQEHTTLQLGDGSSATGLMGDFLQAVGSLYSEWTDWRLLVEQIARDVGRELSLHETFPEFPDPRQHAMLAVEAGSLEWSGPETTAVTCQLGATTLLELTCSTESTEPQGFSIEGTYASDFGEQSVRIDGTLYPTSAVIETVSGGGQQAYPGDELQHPLVVRVYDAREGTAIDGATISWTASDGGTTSPATTVTNIDGLASTTWTVGGTEGEQSVTATALLGDGTQVPGEVVFPATVDRGEMLQKMYGDNQIGEPGEALPDSLVVRVVDRMAQPVEGAIVSWSASGDGGLDRTSTYTDANGRAAVVWYLGVSGEGQVTAALLDEQGQHEEGSAVTFTLAGPHTGTVMLSVDSAVNAAVATYRIPATGGAPTLLTDAWLGTEISPNGLEVVLTDTAYYSDLVRCEEMQGTTTVDANLTGVIGIDGSGLRSFQGGVAGRWSADGSKIFTSVLVGDERCAHNEAAWVSASGGSPTSLSSRTSSYSRAHENSNGLLALLSSERYPVLQEQWSEQSAQLEVEGQGVVWSSDTGYGSNVVWSPDDQSVLFLHGRTAYRYDVGGGAVPIASDRVSKALWSPDGGRVALLRADGVYVMPSTGGTETYVGPAGALYSWALSGNAVLVGRTDTTTDTEALIMMMLDGTTTTLYTTKAGWDLHDADYTEVQ